MPFPAIIFDDGRGLLAPLTDLRAAFDLRTGMTTTLDRFEQWLDIAALFVPEPLAAVTAERYGADTRGDDALPVNSREFAASIKGPVLMINGRSPMGAAIAADLKPGQVIREPGTGDIVAAVCRAEQIDRLLAGDIDDLTQILTPRMAESFGGPRPMLLSRPWHIRSWRDECLRADLEWHAPRIMKDVGWPELPTGTLCLGTNHLAISREADLAPGVFLDSTLGHIIIDADAVVRPGAIICGPAYIGPHSHVLERTLIKPNTVIGPHCKVAGEVGGTIFQGFANKAHDGHLGDSYIGEWANLGAGTTNSNLLNTYGEVIARPLGPDGKPGSNERTGEQFLGAIIGDHCKFAICTRIMTGAVVGTGTMWSATAPVTGSVPRLSWVTDAGTKPYATNKFIEVAKTVMARRKVEMSGAYRARLEGLV